MKPLVVGGRWSSQEKGSKVAMWLSSFMNCELMNGGNPEHLKAVAKRIIGLYDLVIWMPDIDNTEVERFYPVKKQGATLICSKVLSEKRTVKDAMRRIFRMSGNAVIAIDKSKSKFQFKLVDALGNLWCDTDDIEYLANMIRIFHNWSQKQVRVATEGRPLSEMDGIAEMYVSYTRLSTLSLTVKRLSKSIIANDTGERYFGNVTARCEKLFPSVRQDKDMLLVSKRNIDKEHIEPGDFVLCEYGDPIKYWGPDKPSIDTAIHGELYQTFKNINYLIHGHSYVVDPDAETENYYPCGDIREAHEIMINLDVEAERIVVNLKNHGFLIGTRTLDAMQHLTECLTFKQRKLGEEKICLS